jgi:hypothetical protein
VLGAPAAPPAPTSAPPAVAPVFAVAPPTRAPAGPAPPSTAPRDALLPAVPALHPAAAAPAAGTGAGGSALPAPAAAPARPAAAAPPAAPARPAAAAPPAAPARMSEEDSELVMLASLTSTLSGMDNDELCELALDKGLGLEDIAKFQQLGEREGLGAEWGLVVMHETHRLRQAGRLSLPPLPERSRAEVAREAARVRSTMELMRLLFG